MLELDEVVKQMTKEMPPWLESLEDEDLRFIRRFVLASGSLKELAKQYSVSYPTLRSRLDRLIAKISAAEDPTVTDEFEREVRALLVAGQITTRTAKSLLKSHRSILKQSVAKKGKKK